MEGNIFEIAAKEKYRYPYRGQITTEDLWDLTQTHTLLVPEVVTSSWCRTVLFGSIVHS